MSYTGIDFENQVVPLACLFKLIDNLEFVFSKVFFINDFDIADVLNAVCEKLIKRHPHIYGDVKVKNEEEVKQNWEKIKLKCFFKYYLTWILHLYFELFKKNQIF